MTTARRAITILWILVSLAFFGTVLLYAYSHSTIYRAVYKANDRVVYMMGSSYGSIKLWKREYAGPMPLMQLMLPATGLYSMSEDTYLDKVILLRAMDVELTHLQDLPTWCCVHIADADGMGGVLYATAVVFPGWLPTFVLGLACGAGLFVHLRRRHLSKDAHADTVTENR